MTHTDRAGSGHPVVPCSTVPKQGPQTKRWERQRQLKRERRVRQHDLQADRVCKPPLHSLRGPLQRHTIIKAKENKSTHVKFTLREQASCPNPGADDSLAGETSGSNKENKEKRKLPPTTRTTAAGRHPVLNQHGFEHGREDRQQSNDSGYTVRSCVSSQTERISTKYRVLPSKLDDPQGLGPSKRCETVIIIIIFVF